MRLGNLQWKIPFDQKHIYLNLYLYKETDTYKYTLTYNLWMHELVRMIIQFATVIRYITDTFRQVKFIQLHTWTFTLKYISNKFHSWIPMDNAKLPLSTKVPLEPYISDTDVYTVLVADQWSSTLFCNLDTNSELQKRHTCNLRRNFIKHTYKSMYYFKE